MAGYYISVGKDRFGPLSEKEVIEGVKKGQISLLDLIFHAQIKEWVMLFQHPDFSDLDSADGDANIEQDSHVVMGLVSDKCGEEYRNGVKALNEDPPNFKTTYWYQQENPHKELKFLDILTLLKSKKVTEHSLISKNPAGPWLPVVEWEEFSPEYRAKYKASTKQDLPDVKLRRKSQRFNCGKYFVVQARENLFKAFCSEISRGGLSLIAKISRCSTNEEVKIIFKDSLGNGSFDAKGVVISERKVRFPGAEEKFMRYGIRITHLSEAGKAFVLKHTTKSVKP